MNEDEFSEWYLRSPFLCERKALAEKKKRIENERRGI